MHFILRVRYVFIAGLLLCAGLFGHSYASFSGENCPSSPAVVGAGTTYDVVFSPAGSPSEQIVRVIKSARKSIRFVSRGFVSKDVSVALFDAARAGKDVQVLLDRKHNKDGYSDAQFLAMMSRPPHVLKTHGQYQSYMIIDDRDLAIGNLSDLPEKRDEKQNASSVLIIHDAKALAQRYMENWQMLWADSEEMKEKAH